MNEECPNIEIEDVRVVILLIDHLNLRPICELHIVVRALQPYNRLSMHMRHSTWARVAASDAAVSA